MVKIGLITKLYTFSAGATIVASEHNSNFDILYNEINGNLDNKNLKANASIADTKLGQIVTAGKVSGTALTLLTNIPSAAGIIPAANCGGFPATNTADNVPQWDGTNSRTLKNGLAVGTSANNLVQLNSSAQLPAIDGSLLTGIAGGFTGMQVFTSTGTWTRPTGVNKCLVKVIGGGGEGGYDNITGHAGGTSSFAGTTTIQATGGGGGIGIKNNGGGAGGVGSGGSLNLTGTTGLSNTGGYPYGIYQKTYGIGGDGLSWDYWDSDWGGGGGGYAEGIIAVTGNATVTVGAGGTGDVAPDGTAGLVVVYW